MIERFTLLAGALATSAALAAPAHEHGIARLNIAVEDRAVLIELDTPLDNLLGFERAPRSAAERRAADAAVARLRDAAALWRFDADAACRSAAVALHSAALGLGEVAAGAAHGDHADLEASWRFDCERPPRALEHGLFEAFARLQRLEVRSVTPAGQSRALLRRAARRIDLSVRK